MSGGLKVDDTPHSRASTSQIVLSITLRSCIDYSRRYELRFFVKRSWSLVGIRFLVDVMKEAAQLPDVEQLARLMTGLGNEHYNTFGPDNL